jgi:hypothetical protein
MEVLGIVTILLLYKKMIIKMSGIIVVVDVVLARVAYGARSKYEKYEL